MDKFSLIRSFRHQNSDHGPADHYMLTGYFPTAGFNPILTPEQPAAGPRRRSSPASSAARGSVPAYVCLPKMHQQRRLGLPRRGRRAVRRSTPTPARPTSPCPTSCRRRRIAADRLDDREQVAQTGRPLPASGRGEGATRRAGAGQRVPRQGVRPDDLARGQAGVRHPRRARRSSATSTAATRSASRA